MGTPLTGAERQARYRARHPEREARLNARRVWVGRLYVGRTLSPESAAALNDETRRYLDRQVTSRAEGRSDHAR